MRLKDWYLFGLVVVLLALMVTVPAIAQDGVTNLTGLHLAVPTYCATGTPGLMVDSASVANAVEIRAAATPEYYFNSSKLDLLGNYIEADLGTEHIMFPSVVAKEVAFTAAAGCNGTVAIVAAGETWIVHSVLANVTTDFACTGDDATLDVGDASDADGFLDLADAELQKADTEGTGFSAGWQGMATGTIGAYLDGVDSGFVYAATTLPITITYLIDETSGETITTGAATFYVTYTRIG